jgi:hypothetical protein
MTAFLRPDRETTQRQAQRRSSMAEGHREAAHSVLDRREHGASIARLGKHFLASQVG